MKKLLMILGLLIFNVSFLIAGFFFYLRALRLERFHAMPSLSNSIVVMGGVLAVLAFFLVRKRWMKFYGIGVMGFIIPSLVYLYFLFNTFSSTYTESRMMRAYSPEQNNGQMRMPVRNPYQYGLSAPLKVPVTDILDVDSVEVTISKGMLGIPILTELRIHPSKNCEMEEQSIDDPYEMRELAYQNVRKRCFQTALFLLDSAIAMKPDYSIALFDRGKLQLHLGNYKEARQDLTMSFFLEYAQDEKMDDWQSFDTAALAQAMNKWIFEDSMKEAPTFLDDYWANYHLQLHLEMIACCNERLME